MATTTHDATGHGTDTDADAGSHNKLYVMIALFLAVLTALEVSTYWMPREVQHSPFFAVGLCALMVVKFVTVTLFFMHLKFDKRFLTVAFYSALILAVCVYLTVLTAFRFWWPADHMISH